MYLKIDTEAVKDDDSYSWLVTIENNCKAGTVKIACDEEGIFWVDGIDSRGWDTLKGAVSGVLNNIKPEDL